MADLAAESGKKPDRFHDLLAQEVEATLNGYMDGTLRQVWLPEPGPGAVALMEAGSLKEANRLVVQWPLEQAGLLHGRVIALHPFSGFGQGSKREQDD